MVLAPLLVLLTVGSGAAADRRPSSREVLERAGRYVAACADEFVHLVAQEVSEQELRPRPSVARVIQRRRLVADLGWVRLAGVHEAIGVRDVFEVDGRAVHGETTRRLLTLLHGQAHGTVAEAEALLDESTHYNLADSSRNINLPTFAFFLLHPGLQPRFSWKRREHTDEGIWVFSFKEKGRPTVVRTSQGKPVYSEGRVWIDARTGIVQRTRIELHFDRVEYRMEVAFEPVAAIGFTLPVRLHESYRTPSSDVEGTSTYSHYRRFTTEARLVP